MKRIVLTWELGGNLGHIAQLLPLAKQLSEQGHEISFVLPDPAIISSAIPEAFSLYPAPRWMHRTAGLPANAISYAELLTHAGYLSRTGLRGLLRSWRSLLSSIQPDLVVAESSPTALLASRSLQIPAATLGNGFAIPPRESPFPPFLNVSEERRKHLQQLEDRLIENISESFKSFGSKKIQKLTDIHDVTETCLLTFSELDHYRNRLQAEYHGAIFGLGNGIHMDWAGKNDCQILAYLQPDSSFLNSMLHNVDLAAYEIIISCPGFRGHAGITDKHSNIRLVQEPIDFSNLLPDCNLVISHAGHGLTAQALLAGVPMLTIPRVAEQWITSRNLHVLGTGETTDENIAPDQVKTAIEKLVYMPEYRKSAHSFAQHYATYNPADTAAKIAALFATKLNSL